MYSFACETLDNVGIVSEYFPKLHVPEVSTDSLLEGFDTRNVQQWCWLLIVVCLMHIVNINQILSYFNAFHIVDQSFPVIMLLVKNPPDL